jgi:hypothetical protein
MGKADTSPPNLPSTANDTVAGATALGCVSSDLIELNGSQAPYPMTSVQVMPSQEPGTAKRVPAT